MTIGHKHLYLRNEPFFKALIFLLDPLICMYHLDCIRKKRTSIHCIIQFRFMYLAITIAIACCIPRTLIRIIFGLFPMHFKQGRYLLHLHGGSSLKIL